MAENRPHTVELRVEIVVELLLFLYPYGADQMGLPHNFWLGLGCWIFGTLIAIRMFWIYPLWSKRLTVLEKSLISALGVIVLVALFYNPVRAAYTNRKPEDRSGKLSPEHENPAPTAAITTAPSPEPKEREQGKQKQTLKTAPVSAPSPPPSPSGYSVTNPNGSIVNQGSPNFGTQTVNNEPPPRTLSESQKAKIFSALSAAPQKITIASLIGDEEAAALASSIADVFEKAGWTVDRVIGRQMMGGRTPEAIMLSFYAPVGANRTTNQTVTAAVSALRDAGLRVGLNADETMSADTVNLFVGSRRSE